MYVPRLKELYDKEVRAALMKEFSYRSVMQIPRLEKIVISAGLGEALKNKKLLDSAVEEIALIAAQRPVKTKARKSVANFKLREGQEIGVKVTLRGVRMYEFLDRLITAALPRMKDFSGVGTKGFDGRGNYSMGIAEQIIFPEIDYDKIERVAGLNINLVTTAKNNTEARVFFEKMGLPFKKR